MNLAISKHPREEFSQLDPTTHIKNSKWKVWDKVRTQMVSMNIYPLGDMRYRG